MNKMKTYQKVLMIILMLLSIDVYADPDPDSIKIAKRVDMAMEEFYAIKAQNDWNDANGLSENNVYIFGMGEYLKNPEDDNFLQISGDGAHQHKVMEIFYQTGLMIEENNALNNLRDDLNDYNDIDEPYEIWVYFAPFQYAVESASGGDQTMYYEDHKELFSDMSAEQIYAELNMEGRSGLIRREEAEDFEHKIWTAISNKLNSQGNKKRIIFFCSYYVDVKGLDAQGEPKLGEDVFLGIEFTEKYSRYLNGDIVMEEGDKLMEDIGDKYTYIEQVLLAYPEYMYGVVNDYLLEENMISFPLSRPKFCTVASVCQYLGITKQTDGVLRTSNYIKDFEKFQIIAEATGKSLNDLYVSEDYTSELVIDIPITLINTETIYLGSEGGTIDDFFNNRGLPTKESQDKKQYKANLAIVQRLTGVDDIKKEGIIKVPDAWVNEEKPIKDFNSNCEQEMKLQVKEVHRQVEESFCSELGDLHKKFINLTVLKRIEKEQDEWDEGWTRLLDDSDFLRYPKPAYFIFFEMNISIGTKIYAGALYENKLQTGIALDFFGIGFYRLNDGTGSDIVYRGITANNDNVEGVDKRGTMMLANFEFSVSVGIKIALGNTVLGSLNGYEIIPGGRDFKDLGLLAALPESAPIILAPNFNPGYSINDFIFSEAPPGGSFTYGFSGGLAPIRRETTTPVMVCMMTYEEACGLIQKLQFEDFLMMAFVTGQVKNKKDYPGGSEGDLFVNGKDTGIRVVSDPESPQVWYTHDYYVLATFYGGYKKNK